MTSKSDGLICAFRFDGGGGASPLPTWNDVAEAPGETAWTWLHLERNRPEVEDWLRRASGLNPNIVEALLAEETRPRCGVLSQGTLLILRGVNLNPNADPEDMVSVRCWVEPQRIITLRHRRLMAADAIRRACTEGRAPTSPGDFVVELTAGLVERMSGVLQDFDEDVDRLEEEHATGDVRKIRSRLVEVRQSIIPLRRYLAPQRDALTQLMVAKVDWLDDWQRGRLREIADQVTRHVEDLDAARERAAVIQDAVAAILAEQMNQVMVVLSIVAAIFLPLGLLTGLLGINVGGIPGAETPWAFWAVCGLLVTVGLGAFWWFARLGWLR